MTRPPKVTADAKTERRRAHRRPILETFSIFLAIPKKGLHKLEVRDLSEDGIGFMLDIEGESVDLYPAKLGDTVDFRFYINSTLFIPLAVTISRIDDSHTGRRVGAQFSDKEAPGYKALLSFLHLLDSFFDVLQIDRH